MRWTDICAIFKFWWFRKTFRSTRHSVLCSFFILQHSYGRPMEYYIGSRPSDHYFRSIC